MIDFNDYWTAMNPLPEYHNRKMAAREEWNNHPEKHQTIMTWLKRHGDYPDRNPYFFIRDFTVPRPRSQEMSFRDYYARFGTTEEQGGWKMITPQGGVVYYEKK